jgi:hypothetical protein
LKIGTPAIAPLSWWTEWPECGMTNASEMIIFRLTFLAPGTATGAWFE